MTFKTGILVDQMGHGFGEVTPEMEVEQHAKDFAELLRPHKIKHYTLRSAHEVKPGTDLVLFDYGGMLPGCGDLILSEVRALFRWAQDNPSSLAVVVSTFTYRNVIQGELQELGLDLPNIVGVESSLDDPIPMWFRAGAKPKPPIKEHPLAGMTPLGGTLSAIQFFKPKKRFISFMNTRFGKRRIYEAGAGMGHTSKALHDAGIEVIAIDSNHREGAVFKVEIDDATDYNYRCEPIVLICRPCHGFLTEAIITQAIRKRAEAIVYVGLPKNTKGDLGQFRRRFRVEMRNAGADRESVYVWRPAWNQNVDDLRFPK